MLCKNCIFKNEQNIYIYEEKSLKYQCMACICFPLNLLFNIHYLYIYYTS